MEDMYREEYCDSGGDLENYTPTSLAKMLPYLLTSLSLNVTVVVRLTCFNPDIRT